VLSHDVVRLVAQLEASGIPLRKTAPEDVIFAIWLMPFEIPRLHTEHIFNHPDVVAASDPNRGFCSVESLIVHYVNRTHFEEIRLSDGVMLCRQNHDKVVSFSFAGDELEAAPSDLGTISAGESRALRIVPDNISIKMPTTLLVHVIPAGQADYVVAHAKMPDVTELEVMLQIAHPGRYEVEVTIVEGQEEFWGHPRWKKSLLVV